MGYFDAGQGGHFRIVVYNAGPTSRASYCLALFARSRRREFYYVREYYIRRITDCP